MVPAAKLTFIYGCMGSAKTAQALIQKFNYEEKGLKVLLLKPSMDTRDGKYIIKSRIEGLKANTKIFNKTESIIKKFNSELKKIDFLIVDEVHFSTKNQIEELKKIVDDFNIPVYAYGLRSNFKSELFEGSKRLMEIADDIKEIESLCHCGRKAIINARYRNGKIIYKGDEVKLGRNDTYKALCYKCYKEGKLK